MAGNFDGKYIIWLSYNIGILTTNQDNQTKSNHHHHLPTVPVTILCSELGTCNHDNHTSQCKE